MCELVIATIDSTLLDCAILYSHKLLLFDISHIFDRSIKKVKDTIL